MVHCTQRDQTCLKHLTFDMQAVRSSAYFVLVGTKLQVVVSRDNSKSKDSGLLGDSVLMNFQRL
jgi:hypothetical protein